MSVLSDTVERIRALLFRRRDERELREELAFHIEMESAQNQRAGMDATEARRRSHLALGGVERTKEDVRDARGTRLVEDSRGDIAFALRTLRRNPGFAIVAILTLAVGIGGTTAVYSAVDAVLLQPLPYQDPGQLVRLYQHGVDNPGDRGVVTPVHFLDYRQRMTSFASTAAVQLYDETGADIGTGDGVHRIRMLMVSADYFDVLHALPAIGRNFSRDVELGSTGPTEDIKVGAAVVVLSHALWQQEFNSDPAAVGKTLLMNGRAFTVVGVMRAGFADPIAPRAAAWVPFDLTAGKDVSNAGNHYLTVLARLRPGVTISRAQAELDLLSLALAKQYPNATDTRATLYPLKSDLVGSSSKTLGIMLGAVALVLVLVCVNIANLLLVRGSERAREFALRSALGGDRRRLVRQMLIESLTLAIAGDIAGLVVARLAMPAITALGAGSIPRLSTLHLEPRLLIVSLVLATLCAVGFGLAPAIRVSRTQPGDVLRTENRSSTGGVGALRMREWLVVAQVAMAFVLLVGAGLLLASVNQIHQVDLGVKPANAFVFELHLPEARYDSTGRGRFYDDFAKRAEEIPGVVAVGGVSKLPASGSYNSWGTRVLTGPVADDTVKSRIGSEQRIISGDYLKAAGIRVVAGRAFDDRDDVHAPSRVLLSANAAKAWFPGVAAVGQRIRTGGHESEVIGVVSDVALDAEGATAPYVYHWHAQWAGDRNWSLMQVVRTTGPATAAESAVRQKLAVLDPQLVLFNPMTLGDAIGRGEAQRLFTLRILVAFALVALALSALGLFGVLSYGVRLRTREFGIRMALGAEAGGIRRMVIRQGLTMTAIGAVAGMLGAVALSRVMASVVFHVSPVEPSVLAGAAIFLVLVASVAAYLPARRATAVDPRSALQ